MKFKWLIIMLTVSITSYAAQQNCSDPKIYTQDDYRYVISNGIPCNHGQFPNAHNPNHIEAQHYQFRMPLNPKENNYITPLGMNSFGVALNGIPFDPAAAEWYNDDPQSGWQLAAMTNFTNLGLDKNHAHVQPNGAYHYHGLPTSLYNRLTKNSKPTNMVLIGYAADGFPIYALYGYKNPLDSKSPLIKVTSSYQLKKGDRPNPPGGQYDGKYVEDFAYVKGTGDLDQCNGVFGVTPQYPKGIYHYFITDSYPFIPRCLRGTPDPSFSKKGRPRDRSRRPPRPAYR